MMGAASTQPYAFSMPGAATWLTADEIALIGLRRRWPEYDTGCAEGRLYAYRLSGGPLLTAAGVAGLDAVIRADAARSGVTR
jgi:hypothetical protein